MIKFCQQPCWRGAKFKFHYNYRILTWLGGSQIRPIQGTIPSILPWAHWTLNEKKNPERLGLSLTRTIRFVLQVVDADWIMSTISFTQIPPRNFQQLGWQVIEKLSATLNSKHWRTGTMYIECTFFGDKYLWEFVRDPWQNGTSKVHLMG